MSDSRDRVCWAMRSAFIAAVVLVGLAVAQETSKPSIGLVVGVPADRTFVGDCTAATQGYLKQRKGHAKLTEAEIGKFVRSNLRKGYVITVYPESQNGIFVDMECASKAPKDAHP